MSGARFEVPDEEPAVRSPALQALVDEVRARPVPSLRVDLEAVRMAAAERRGRRWRTMAVAVAAVAVAAVGISLTPRASGPTETSDAPAVARTSSPSVAVPETSAPSAPPVVGPVEPEVPPPATPAVPHLAAGVTFEPRDAARARFTVVSTWSVDVASGVYRIEVPADAVTSLRVSVPDGRVLEVHPGAEVELDAAGRGRATVLEGSATWIDADGQRHALAPKRAKTEGAASLARTADEKMAEGDRAGAIEALESLVRKHPRSAAAKAGLLDLARLYRADGRTDRARCAYGMYLQRWPGSRVQSEVERALADLGGGDCHSL